MRSTATPFSTRTRTGPGFSNPLPVLAWRSGPRSGGMMGRPAWPGAVGSTREVIRFSKGLAPKSGVRCPTSRSGPNVPTLELAPQGSVGDVCSPMHENARGSGGARTSVRVRTFESRTSLEVQRTWGCPRPATCAGLAIDGHRLPRTRWKASARRPCAPVTRIEPRSVVAGAVPTNRQRKSGASARPTHYLGRHSGPSGGQASGKPHRTRKA